MVNLICNTQCETIYIILNLVHICIIYIITKVKEDIYVNTLLLNVVYTFLK